MKVSTTPFWLSTKGWYCRAEPLPGLKIFAFANMFSKIHVTYTKDHPHVFYDKHLYGILFEVYSLKQEPSAICRHTEQKGELKRTQVIY